jgi:hypothetical protein
MLACSPIRRPAQQRNTSKQLQLQCCWSCISAVLCQRISWVSQACHDCQTSTVCRKPFAADLNSTVPTAVLGNMGVNTKWLRGDTTTTCSSDSSRSHANWAQKVHRLRPQNTLTQLDGGYRHHES